MTSRYPAATHHRFAGSLPCDSFTFASAFNSRFVKTFFVDVILPLALPKALTYRLPKEMAGHAGVGVRAVVPLGKRKLMTGIILRIHENPPREYTAKYVDDLLDPLPVVNERQIKFWTWMAEYYLTTLGEVLLAALPGAMRLTSHSKYVINPNYDGDASGISADGETVLFALTNREVMTGEEISDLLGKKNIGKLLKELMEAGALLATEEVKEQYKPKLVTYVRLTEAHRDEKGLEAAFGMVEKAERQLQVLLAYVQLSALYEGDLREVRRQVLQKVAGVNSAAVKTLVDKGIFELYDKQVDRIPVFEGDTLPRPSLSAAQREALASIDEAHEHKNVVLLHGVTSSGKTEIYVERIRRHLDRGEQVLYILPEIALTAQMISRLQSYFGDEVAVYHSRLNQQERVELWNRVLDPDEKRTRLILGARSAIFLPFHNLGLVIVDEEHETSFKQFRPAPRYHARDSAIVLASIHQAKTLLGSATPSFESMHNARTGKYGYVHLNERYGGMHLPEIQAVPLPAQKAGYFSEALLEAMKESLDKKEQVILFQNRRGYAPIMLCLACGWAPECTRCDVSVTYHKGLNRFVCHYCGNRYGRPPACPACGSADFKLAGFGTERIEEELPIHFPDARIARLDMDTTRSKMAYSQILNDFQDGYTDILIGTQMVTKGLDFDRVSLVGILNADLLLRFPDFRSTERGFQLMTQVAGRAGRRQKRGKVLIQTRNVDQWVIQKVIDGDYDYVLERELKERHEYSYPPFARLIRLTFVHRESELVDHCSARYYERLIEFLDPKFVLGPEYPAVKRIKNRYLKDIVLKIMPPQSPSEFKSKLVALNRSFFADAEFRAVRLVIDVDPQ